MSIINLIIDTGVFSMLLQAQDSLLIVIDPQASLMPMVVDGGRVTKVTNKLISIARELSVPRIITEHFPEKLKPSIPEIAEHLADDYKPITKKAFSCFGEVKFRNALAESGRKTLVLTGIETHICVLQTALQCKKAGYKVFVAVDGVSCRSQFDHDTAIRRMEQHGVVPITWEMIAYEWMRLGDSPEFRKVLPHIKSGL
ncbi:MAG: hydrolase [Planctomycetes bacterium]|nr:hydrolase [Planctomycetota bacterium]